MNETDAERKKRFLRLYEPLALYVKHGMKSLDLVRDEKLFENPKAAAEVRDRLWNNRALIREYADQADLSPEDRQSVLDFAYALFGDFFIVGHTEKKGFRFLHGDRVFLVKDGALAEKITEVPILVHTVLIPFEGKIMTDDASDWKACGCEEDFAKEVRRTERSVKKQGQVYEAIPLDSSFGSFMETPAYAGKVYRNLTMKVWPREEGKETYCIFKFSETYTFEDFADEIISSFRYFGGELFSFLFCSRLFDSSTRELPSRKSRLTCFWRNPPYQTDTSEVKLGELVGKKYNRFYFLYDYLYGHYFNVNLLEERLTMKTRTRTLLRTHGNTYRVVSPENK